MFISYRDIFYIIKTTFVEFLRDHSLIHGAALAYYMILALIPMIYLSVEVSAGIVGDRSYMIMAIEKTLSDTIGYNQAHSVSVFLDKIDFSKAKFLTKILGIGTLIFTSTAIFIALKKSINHFWNLSKVKEKVMVRSLLFRLLSFGFLILVGLLIVSTYFIQVALASVGEYFQNEFSQSLKWSFGVISNFVSISVNVIVFSLIFKFLHDGLIKWKMAFWGAIVTSILVFVGQYILKIYMNNLYFSHEFGVTGTLLMILTYVFYSSQIIFFGAKFTYVFAKVSGNPILQRK